MEVLQGVGEIPWEMVVLAALSLSLGWGIRGNFGHETGAALPGALATMAVVLLSGRPDWYERIAFFAMFGALGWSFGGSMSYMHVVGYTHSGHSGSILYGYANLFLIGFLWAALGGLGAALPAVLTGEQLAAFLVPFLAVFVAWALKEILVDSFYQTNPMRRHESPLYWYDTDWLDVLFAVAAVLLVVLVRGGFDIATSLILYMGVGWYAAFLLLVNVFKLRMTPPRGDNWSGCVGLVAGALVFTWRYGMPEIAFAMLLTGFVGGIGYALAQLLKLIGLRTGRQTNWHSVLEQLQGLFYGIGLALTLGLLAMRLPKADGIAALPNWGHLFAVGFVLILLTYVNHRKAVGTWIEQVASLPERLYGIPAAGYFLRSKGWFGWFELGYLAVAAALLGVLALHSRSPLPFIPPTWLGKGALLYLVFLWWIVVFNFERALTGFTPQRLITEGVILLNAAFSTLFLAWAIGRVGSPQTVAFGTSGAAVRDVALWGTLLALVFALAEWGATRLLYGDRHAPGAGLHIRFGPNATVTKERPKSGERHP